MWSCVLQFVFTYIIFLNSFGECAVNNDAIKTFPMIYTTSSKSVNGKWCINDCVDERCVVDINAAEDCLRSNNPAPTYYTTGQQYSGQRKCTSLCTRLSGDVRPRCYVANDWSKLDFCNPDLTNTFEYRDFTINNGPCVNDCQIKARGLPRGTCYDITGILRECFNDKYLYARVMTLSEYKCNGECLRHEGTSYNWCYYYGSKWDYCALPALHNTTCINCTETIQRQLQETVTKYAEQMESDSSLKTVAVSDPKNPIYSYTYNETMTLNGPVKLPLVLRAKVYRSHINPKNSRGNVAVSVDSKENCRRMGMTEEDDIGRLIPYKFGGPVDFYNFVPMARAINIGSESDGSIYAPSAWVSTEREIAEFVGSENGQVNIIVVLRYNLNDHGYPYRPYRIGWGQWGLTTNGDVVLKSRNYWNTHKS